MKRRIVLDHYKELKGKYNDSRTEFEYNERKLIEWLDCLRHRMVTVKVGRPRIRAHKPDDTTATTFHSATEMTGLVGGWRAQKTANEILHIIELIQPGDEFDVFSVPCEDLVHLAVRTDLERQLDG